MSQENLEIARHLLARWECGDYHHAGVFDPQVLFTRTGGGSDVLGYTTESRGLVGLQAALQAWTEEWTDVRVEVEQLLAVGERVLALVRHSGLGRSSGVALDHLDGWVFSFSDGRIERWDAYWNPAEARRALDLTE
jgi:ketosteroid isomerase-like protein